MVAVILIHSTAQSYKDYGQIPLYDWWFANIVNACSRFAVPMFVMISGCVLLGKRYDTMTFYLKRGKRLLPAFLFWSFLYLAFDYFIKDVPLNQILFRLKFGIFISGKAYFHLWYLSMFICLMLFVPFINNYIRGQQPVFKDFIFLLSFIALFFFMNQISQIGWELFDVNIGWFKLFPWYIGYFIMGHFIDTYSEKIPVGNTSNIVLLCSVLSLSSILNYYCVVTLDIVKDSFILNNTGILMFISTSSIFYLFSKNKGLFKENLLISHIASMSFGIYLIHPVFLYFSRKSLIFFVNEPIILMTLQTVTTFIFSYLTISMLSKCKWIRTLC